MTVYFDVGLPEGHHSVVRATTLELTPKLISISPSSGSIGGSVVTATVAGIGAATAGVDLVDSSGASICQNVTIVSYGTVHCLTMATAISEQNISVTVGSTNYSCENTTATACLYRQVSSDGFPKVSSVSSTTTQLVLTGSNFFTSSYTANASLSGVHADSITIDSAT